MTYLLGQLAVLIAGYGTVSVTRPIVRGRAQRDAAEASDDMAYWAWVRTL